MDNRQDFDRGFGIGGLGKQDEEVVIPTAPEAERMTEQTETMRCRRCRGTEWSGAMFTTLPSSGLCDDCV